MSAQRHVLGKLLLFVITMLRVGANCYFGRPVTRRICIDPEVLPEDGWEDKSPNRCRYGYQFRLTEEVPAGLPSGTSDWKIEEVYVDYSFVIDFAVRPLVSGLGVYVYLSRPERYSALSPLHVWSRRSVLWLFLASTFVDDSITGLHASLCGCHFEGRRATKLAWSPIQICLFAIGLLVSNLLQVAIANLKLKCLGFQRFAACILKFAAACVILFLIAFVTGVILVVVSMLDSVPQRSDPRVIFWYVVVWIFISLSFLIGPLQAVGMASAVRGAVKNLDWANIRSEIGCLCVNCFLTLVGCPLSVGVAAVLWQWGIPDRQLQMLLLLDLTFQTFNSLVLAGMLGPKLLSRPLDAFSKVGSYRFGLAAKRIAFPGKINPAADMCIVSFPGVYSEEWDAAVSAASQEQTYSLACVFLTDTASGLGRHEENPQSSGECYCKALYGELPPDAYLSLIESTDEQLRFKIADSQAMGQVLLIKYPHTTELDWEAEKARGMQKAQELCRENQSRAPWGCAWFHLWKENVHEAAEQNQSLHVFYFQDKVGAGKVPWHLLGDADVRKKARKSGGLGNSQTAEVAYLDKLGLPYVEHDVMAFGSFLRPAQSKLHTAESSVVCGSEDMHCPGALR